MVRRWSIMAMAPILVMHMVVRVVNVAPRLENVSAFPPRVMARSILSACFSSHWGRMARSSARALMVVRPAIISAIRLSRLCEVSRSSELAPDMTEAERHAMKTNSGNRTSSTHAMAGATTKITPRNRMAKGRSAIKIADAPDSVLRTMSTSRNSDCQCAPVCVSRVFSGSEVNFWNTRCPTSTSTRRATRCMMRERDWRRI